MEPDRHAPEATPDLWITARCLTSDLELSDGSQDAVAREGHHQLVAAFVQKRGTRPEGQETIGLESRGTWYTLHADRYRGVTWHQRTTAVVWLAGAGYHREGDRNDAYAAIRDLDESGRLAPVRSDYESLDAWRVRRLAEELVSMPPKLVASAREHPGEIQTALLAGRIGVRVAVEPGEPEFLTVAIKTEMLPGPAKVPKHWIVQLLAAFFGERGFEELSFTEDIVGQPLRDECGYCYFDHGSPE